MGAVYTRQAIHGSGASKYRGGTMRILGSEAFSLS
jgi:hypothetical protein